MSSTRSFEGFTIYHNPKCSKSRATLALLQESGQDYEVCEYLQTSPSLTELENLFEMLQPLPLSDFIRDAGLAGQGTSLALAAIAKDPALLQRPIVVWGGKETGGAKAVIGRPPEKVLELIGLADTPTVPSVPSDSPSKRRKQDACEIAATNTQEESVPNSGVNDNPSNA